MCKVFLDAIETVTDVGRKTYPEGSRAWTNPEERVFAWAARGRLRPCLYENRSPVRAPHARARRRATERDRELLAKAQISGTCRRRAADAESVQMPDSGRGSKHGGR